MPTIAAELAARSASALVFEDKADAAAIPIRMVPESEETAATADLDAAARRWIEATAFTGAAKKVLLLPDAEGRLARVLIGSGKGNSGEPCGPSSLLIGHLPSVLPPGLYRLEGEPGDATLAAVAWGLGAYKFQVLKSTPATAERPRLVVPAAADTARAKAVVDGIWLGRDLINLPPGHLGPEDLEAAARTVAAAGGATVSSIVGDDLLAERCHLIHAVGRASTRAPRLIDIVWGRSDARRVTIVGKGICFDTGGLDIKPASSMLLMKKDMGGAASALALARMIMASGLDVRLRVLIPAAENSIGGNAFRPSDVVTSRSGKTVEIGNTDAEGRLVLADALDIADEEAPDLLVTLATLTGAARVALGPDLPPLFSDDDELATRLVALGGEIGDPVWRMPLWQGYARNLDSDVADFNNVSDGPFAGAVTAALFLRRFVTKARRFAHFDIYGWRPSARALGPKGGEPHAARLLYDLIRGEADVPPSSGPA